MPVYGSDVINPFFGKYKGFVRDNKDPDNRGRIRVFCPQVMGPADAEDAWLGWAEPNFPWAGGSTMGDSGPPFTREEQRGAQGREYFGVWIEFEMGHVDFPIWCGCFPIAPKKDSPTALQMGTDGGGSLSGGGILQGKTPLNPVKAEVQREMRIRAPRGVDIMIGSEDGGGIIVGPSGVHIVGTQVSINGQLHLATSTKKTGG